MLRVERSGQGASDLGGRPALLGLLAIQSFLGYEWLMSGVSKLLKGGFVSGLAEDVVFRADNVPSWYRQILDAVVIPNSRLIGSAVVIGELFLGTALIAASLIWATRWPRLSVAGRSVVLVAILIAGGVAILANVNYHIYTGSSHPWIVAADPFGEGVDLDSLMPVLQAILAAVSARYLLALHRGSTST